MPQVPAMMAGTVAENIRLGCSDAPEAMLRDAWIAAEPRQSR
ncbi:transport ATP-binding protein CydD [Cutibacterium acnes JCM 18909]|nr:transport ATP-binding protein CydD [Cutibacterium acnes JCM 18909]